MKSKALLSMAVAGAFACSTGAYAGWNSHEVQTPSSVSESAPWLAAESSMPAAETRGVARMDSEQTSTITSAARSSSAIYDSGSSNDVAYVEYWLIGSEPVDGTGVSSSASGFGAVGFDSTASAPGVGMSSSVSGLGSSTFEPASSAFEMTLFTPSALEIVHEIGDATPLLSEHYLVPSPESGYDPSDYAVLMIGPGAEDVALLDALSEYFFILTPADTEA